MWIFNSSSNKPQRYAIRRQKKQTNLQGSGATYLYILMYTVHTHTHTEPLSRVMFTLTDYD